MTEPIEPADETNPADEQTEEHQDEPADEPEMFPAEVVRKLRDENAKLRVRAQQTDEHAERADTYATRLHTELVRATGLLADPTDLAFDAEHLTDDQRLVDAIEALIAAKPHLKARRFGNVGQGRTGDQRPTADLGELLRARV